MKKLILCVAALALLAGVAFGQDDNPLDYKDYTNDNTASIYVYAYMTGVLYSLNTTEVYFDGNFGTADIGLRPGEFDTEQEVDFTTTSEDGALIQLQNDGGVNIDLFVWVPVTSEDVGGMASTWDLDIEAGTYPNANEYKLFMLFGENEGTYAEVTAGASWVSNTTNNQLTNTATEVDDVSYSDINNAYAADGGGVRAAGLNLIAFDPDDATDDKVEINFAYWAPATAGDPGSPTTPHIGVVCMRAKLAD